MHFWQLVAVSLQALQFTLQAKYNYAIFTQASAICIVKTLFALTYASFNDVYVWNFCVAKKIPKN